MMQISASYHLPVRSYERSKSTVVTTGGGGVELKFALL